MCSFCKNYESYGKKTNVFGIKTFVVKIHKTDVDLLSLMQKCTKKVDIY